LLASDLPGVAPDRSGSKTYQFGVPERSQSSGVAAATRQIVGKPDSYGLRPESKTNGNGLRPESNNACADIRQ